jgi:hypothetical protein
MRELIPWLRPRAMHLYRSVSVAFFQARVMPVRRASDIKMSKLLASAARCPDRINGAGEARFRLVRPH